MANYFDVLSPMCRLSLPFQKDEYDPMSDPSSPEIHLDHGKATVTY